jgi:CheY-like chemotaxis protein
MPRTKEKIQRRQKPKQCQRKNPHPRKPKNMPKVLLAEDDHTMVMLLTTLLKMEGFEVVALSADADIPGAVVNEKPNSLLMDVNIGKQNGLDLVQAIRNDPANTNLNIVMASGYNLKEECLQRGANHFLLKPFMPDDLLKLLK